LKARTTVLERGAFERLYVRSLEGAWTQVEITQPKMGIREIRPFLRLHFVLSALGGVSVYVGGLLREASIAGWNRISNCVLGLVLLERR
jgi:hypothetical protein